jgi:hypothetical protein
MVRCGVVPADEAGVQDQHVGRVANAPIACANLFLDPQNHHPAGALSQPTPPWPVDPHGSGWCPNEGSTLSTTNRDEIGQLAQEQCESWLPDAGRAVHSTTGRKVGRPPVAHRSTGAFGAGVFVDSRQRGDDGRHQHAHLDVWGGPWSRPERQRLCRVRCGPSVRREVTSGCRSVRRNRPGGPRRPGHPAGSGRARSNCRTPAASRCAARALRSVRT